MTDSIAFRKETTFGASPGTFPQVAPSALGTGQWCGLIPYFRRTLKRTGAVVVYFRTQRGKRVGHCVLDTAERAKIFVPGKSYTVEMKNA